MRLLGRHLALQRVPDQRPFERKLHDRLGLQLRQHRVRLRLHEPELELPDLPDDQARRRDELQQSERSLRLRHRVLPLSLEQLGERDALGLPLSYGQATCPPPLA